ncbi:MAG: zf-HC2 domain-containing protein [Nitrospira sp.]|nr:zf-HC2 domain-containing protein [Nitrospira sp.]
MQRFLHSYLDGELFTRDAVEIQSHLDNCSACTALYRNEKLFLDLLRKSIPRSHAPIGLEAKVKQALDTVCRREKPRAWFRRIAVPASAVAVLAGVVVVAMQLFVGNPVVPDIVGAAVATHERYASKSLQLNIHSHEPAEVSRWLQEQAGFTVSLTQAPVKNLNLLGGRLVEVNGQKAVFVAYDVGGHPLSLVITAAQGVKLFGGQEMVDKDVRFYQSSYHGLQTLSWSLEGMAYVFVSDAQELNKQACLICHTSSRDLKSSGGHSAVRSM